MTIRLGKPGPGAREIFSYLLKLERERKFAKSAWSLDSDLKEPIRKRLAEQLTGGEEIDEGRRVVCRLVNEELKIQ